MGEWERQGVYYVGGGGGGGGGGSMDDGTNRAKRRVVLRGLTWVSGNTRECTTWGGGGGEHGRWNQQSEEESGP